MVAAMAGKELTLVRCENARQTAFIRVELGPRPPWVYGRSKSYT